MGTSYYYFAASLPMLAFEGAPPFSCESFLDDCKRIMQPKDFDVIYNVVDGTGTVDNSVAKAWQQFEDSFRNEAAWFRASEINRGPSDYMRGERSVDPLVVEALAQAAKSSDLFEGEKILDLARWDFLDTLVQGHFFDIEFLIVYAVKLKILERYKHIESRKGREVFEAYKDFIAQQEIVNKVT